MGSMETNLEKKYFLQQDVSDGISHAICVSCLAGRLAAMLQEEQTVCYDLAVAGTIHDIGKIKLSSYLYGRDEEALDVEQMKYIHQHTELGYEIAREHGYPEHIQQWILHHHENYDGSGYPFHLKGEEIPYGARILRVCDVFAALTADRPYRRAFDLETAMDLMIEEIKNFDMRIFLAFQRMVHEEDINGLLNQKDLQVEIQEGKL